MSEQTPKKWQGTGQVRSRKDAPGGDKGTIWGTLQGVTVSKVWASVQGGVEERLSKVVKGHVLNFCERSKGRKERIQVYDAKFIAHFPKILRLRLPAPGQGYHHVTRRKWEPSFSSFLLFLFLIPHWWINMSAFQYRLSAFFSVRLFCSSECVTGASYYSPILSPSASRLAVAQPSRTRFSGEIKLIDSLVSWDFTCHKFQAAKSSSRGALSGFGESTKTEPTTEATRGSKNFHLVVGMDEYWLPAPLGLRQCVQLSIYLFVWNHL